MLRASRIIAVVLLGMPLAARAEQVMFMFPLDAAQEVQTPAVVSPGTGTGHVMYDTVTNAIEWDISFSGLVSPVIMAHFHGPAAVGANATVVLGVPTAGGTSGALQGSDVFPEQHEQSLLNGLIYFNIHTSTYPGGEIRGQVVPEPAALLMLAFGSVAIIAHRRRQRS